LQILSGMSSLSRTLARLALAVVTAIAAVGAYAETHRVPGQP
jgi:hypothetical protein